MMQSHSPLLSRLCIAINTVYQILDLCQFVSTPIQMLVLNICLCVEYMADAHGSVTGQMEASSTILHRAGVKLTLLGKLASGRCGRQEEAHSPPGCQHPLESSTQRPGHAMARLCSRRASLPTQNFIIFYRTSKKAALQMDK